MRFLPVCLLVAGCAPQAPVPESRESTAVDTITVETVVVEERLPAMGTVHARNTVILASRILSYVSSVSVRPGDMVSPGQIVVTLNDRELRSDVDAARANGRQAEASIRAAEQAVVAAAAELRLAQLTYVRHQDLLAKDSVSQHEFDLAEARLHAIRAALAAAESVQAQAEAQRDQTDAALARADVALGDATVTSPIAGLVTERLVDSGALAAPGAPLLRIDETGVYQLEVPAPESTQRSVSVGQAVPLEIDALAADGPSEGVIIEIVPAIDADSRTFMVTVELPMAPDLRPGQFGTVFLPGASREALYVPTVAVIKRGQLRFVSVVEDGKARRRAVTLGDQRDSTHEVLSGLQPGDHVIVAPAGLGDGETVSVRESEV